MLEGNKLYNILCVRWGNACPMTLAEEWAGRQDKELIQPLRGLYLERMLQKLERAIAGVQQGSGENNETKLEYLRNIHSALTQTKKEWDEWQG